MSEEKKRVESKEKIEMMDDSDIFKEELLLTDADFPDNYVQKAHPDDYKIVAAPLAAQYTYFQKSHHNRLLLRYF